MTTPIPGEFANEHYTPTAITAAYPPVVTVAGHPFEAGDRLRFTNFNSHTGMTQVNDQLYVVQQPTTDTFQLWDIYGAPVDGRSWGTFTPTSTAQITLTGPDLYIQNPAPPNVYTLRIYPWQP